MNDEKSDYISIQEGSLFNENFSKLSGFWNLPNSISLVSDGSGFGELILEFDSKDKYEFIFNPEARDNFSCFTELKALLKYIKNGPDPPDELDFKLSKELEYLEILCNSSNDLSKVLQQENGIIRTSKNTGDIVEKAKLLFEALESVADSIQNSSELNKTDCVNNLKKAITTVFSQDYKKRGKSSMQFASITSVDNKVTNNKTIDNPEELSLFSIDRLPFFSGLYNMSNYVTMKFVDADDISSDKSEINSKNIAKDYNVPTKITDATVEHLVKIGVGRI